MPVMTMPLRSKVACLRMLFGPLSFSLSSMIIMVSVLEARCPDVYEFVYGSCDFTGLSLGMWRILCPATCEMAVFGDFCWKLSGTGASAHSSTCVWKNLELCGQFVCGPSTFSALFVCLGRSDPNWSSNMMRSIEMLDAYVPCWSSSGVSIWYDCSQLTP